MCGNRCRRTFRELSTRCETCMRIWGGENALGRERERGEAAIVGR